MLGMDNARKLAQNGEKVGRLRDTHSREFVLLLRVVYSQSVL